MELFLLCASDREDAALWSEFLGRYACTIKRFIRAALRRNFGSASDPGVAAVRGGIQESDLLQNTILRLVENDCAAMKRFSGTTEGELLAYLAVISRSVVTDAMRRHSDFGRHVSAPEVGPEGHPDNDFDARDIADRSDLEREFLGRELASLTQRTLRNLSGPAFSRDRLVVDLYFSHGLSFQQIAQLKGVNLSKGGVEKVLKRLVTRVRTLASAGKIGGEVR